MKRFQFLSVLLSLFPGVGHAYLGLFKKGLQVFVVTTLVFLFEIFVYFPILNSIFTVLGLEFLIGSIFALLISPTLYVYMWSFRNVYCYFEHKYHADGESLVAGYPISLDYKNTPEHDLENRSKVCEFLKHINLPEDQLITYFDTPKTPPLDYLLLAVVVYAALWKNYMLILTDKRLIIANKNLTNDKITYYRMYDFSQIVLEKNKSSLTGTSISLKTSNNYKYSFKVQKTLKEKVEELIRFLDNKASFFSYAESKKYSVISKLLSYSLAILLLIASVILIATMYWIFQSSAEKDNYPNVLTDQEWDKVKKDMEDNYLFSYINQQVMPEPNPNIPESNPNKFFLSAYNISGIPNAYNSQTSDETANVLGDFDGKELEKNKTNTYLSKLRLTGEVLDETINITEGFDLLLTNISTISNDNSSGISDTLVNGSMGDLIIGDSVFDAAHISSIKLDPKSAYVKAEVSDIALIVLDRLKNGQNMGVSESGIVSATYDNVYPHFDKYVELAGSDFFPEESINDVYYDSYNNHIISLLQQTIGNIDNYLSMVGSEKDEINQNSIIRVFAKVDNAKFLQGFLDFLKQSSYLEFCKTLDQPDIEPCNASLSQYYSEDDIPDLNAVETLALANIFNFNKFDLLLDENTKDIVGIDLELEISRIFFESFKDSGDKDDSLLNQLKSLNIHILSLSLPHKELNQIAKPPAYRVLHDDSTHTDLQSNQPSQSEEVQRLSDELYEENRRYVSEIWDEDISSLDSIRKEHCQNLWTPNFCFEYGESWFVNENVNLDSNIYDPNPSLSSNPTYDQVILQYPSTSQRNSSRYIVLSFNNDSELSGFECKEEGYDDFRYLATKDDYKLKLFRSESLDTNLVQIQICFENKDGSYTSISPYSKVISAGANNLTFEEIATRISPILQSLNIASSEDVEPIQEVDFSGINNKYETYYHGGSESDPNSCEVNFTRDDSGFSQDYENIKKDLFIDRDFLSISIKDGTVFCQNSICLKCSSNEITWTEQVECKGFTCNP